MVDSPEVVRAVLRGGAPRGCRFRVDAMCVCRVAEMDRCPNDDSVVDLRERRRRIWEHVKKGGAKEQAGPTRDEDERHTAKQSRSLVLGASCSSLAEHVERAGLRIYESSEMAGWPSAFEEMAARRSRTRRRRTARCGMT